MRLEFCLSLFLLHTIYLFQIEKLTTHAVITAGLLSVVFLFSGNLIFQYLGITENDFRIGGGIVLLVLAIVDLLFSPPEMRKSGDSSVGVVPIGIPLIMGPAALTSVLIVGNQFGAWLTLGALTLNLIIIWIVFRNSESISKLMGPPVSKAVAKITSLFLVAIGVMMIRIGVMGVLGK
jgi:multiple antibiotic resistance protein